MAFRELPKIYDPSSIEPSLYRQEESADFRPDPGSDRPPFSMVLPPPNITGFLHLGHALNITLQDILARWRRMSGDDVLWLPGTDHAGIATQNVVERQLMAEGTDRKSIGREAFVEQVWKWKEKSGGMIVKQLKQLGASCDWSRERFTMDPGLSKAVREVFVRLYEEGLIYRAKRLINWCPRCRTALSDLEVEYATVAGKLYYIRYPFKSGQGGVTVATTRPETMLGDTAVAVHPDDKRYVGLAGEIVILPLAGRSIPIIADNAVDSKFGTGAVKVTPAHDPNDFEMGRRHRLPTLQVIEERGRMTKEAGERYAGLLVLEARDRVLSDLREQGVLEKVEEHTHAVGHCYRCRSVVEPIPSLQWFVRVNDPQNSLAAPAIEAVKEGRIRVVPQGWQNNYFGWMENIRDWCISRQIWWGHQLPVWYCLSCAGRPDAQKTEEELREALQEAAPIVARQEPAACPRGHSDLVRDPDVLDTWFSSALWPFSTLGWPEESPDLNRFYPTSVLVTSFDILFFWVARMIMMGLHFCKEVPFKTIYIHALVRDAEGQKMSKSKGNVIDPLEVMERYGTDALRFTLAAMASPGRDIRLSEERIEGYRNFGNKIWNAARFALLHLPEGFSSDPSAPPAPPSTLPNRWILSRLARAADRVESSLSDFRFDEAARILYAFIWHEVCDWYIEAIKPDLSPKGKAFGDPDLAEETSKTVETRRTLSALFDLLLRLLHPFMPFLTEAIAQRPLARASYPATRDLPWAREDLQAEEEMERVMTFVTAVRSVRSELGLAPKAEPSVVLRAARPHLYLKQETYIRRLAHIGEIQIASGPRRKFSVVAPLPDGEIEILLEGLLDLEQEKKRQERVLAKIDEELGRIDAKFSRPDFAVKAPAEVVERDRKRREDLLAKRAKSDGDRARLEDLQKEANS